MLMKVSHESPISILAKSKEYNDFDYCLVHLLDQHPEYLNYYKTAKEYDREVLLDNSIFELGKAFDSAQFFKWVNELQPNMFIVPDVLENAQETMQSYIKHAEYVKQVKQSFTTKAIGAIQGRTWNELKNCYRFMSYEADMIALSFDFSYYEIVGEGDTKLERFCSGRQRFITDLINTGVWDWSKPHHLLGCSLAKEFRFYVDRNIYNIVSCDTSNPIVAAIHGLKYDADYGLQSKPTTKLADLITHEFTQDQLDLVNYNTSMFKKIIRR